MRQSLIAYALEETPRYTSYPTAVQFHDGVGAADARAFAGALAPTDDLSLYVHTPFCEALCWYCGCRTSVPNGYARVARYVATLRREIDLWAAALPPTAGARHVHFGGGSPNALRPEDFADILDRLRRRFGVRPDADVDVELDPRSLSDAFVEAMSVAGVTRASLGVQTLDPVVQAAVGRLQPLERVIDAVAALRAAGVRALNVDVMYGLPHQTVESVVETVSHVAALGADRVAVFGYAHVPWFAKHQRAIDETALPGVRARMEQADAAERALTARGYVAIGFDHYARPHDALARAAAHGRLARNFQGYTTDRAAALIPLGASAVGAFPGGYVQNAKDVKAWAAAVEAGGLPVVRGVALTGEDRLRRDVVMRLLCDRAVDVAAVCAAHGRPADALDDALARLAPLVRDGLAGVEERAVRLTADGRRFARTVAACFDAYLIPARGRHAAAV